MLKFIAHSRCTTCKRARDFLDKNGVPYEERDISAENPTRAELEGWLEMCDQEVQRLFNTSGTKYRELKLKTRLPEMSEDEALDLLASDGMLVKRPVLVGDDFAVFGFREAEWSEKCR